MGERKGGEEKTEGKRERDGERDGERAHCDMKSLYHILCQQDLSDSIVSSPTGLTETLCPRTIGTVI